MLLQDCEQLHIQLEEEEAQAAAQKELNIPAHQLISQLQQSYLPASSLLPPTVNQIPLQWLKDHREMFLNLKFYFCKSICPLVPNRKGYLVPVGT